MPRSPALSKVAQLPFTRTQLDQVYAYECGQGIHTVYRHKNTTAHINMLRTFPHDPYQYSEGITT